MCKWKKTLSLLLLSFILPINVFAYSDYIFAGGQNIGIELHSKGIIVVGTYEIDKTPKNSDIKVGDIITKVHEIPVNSITDMAQKINEYANQNQVDITFLRNGKEAQTTLNLNQDQGIYKTGLYVKDQITGIGTLTFVDPNTHLFGALGHEIIEKNSGLLLEIQDGKIYSSTVTGVESSINGEPGEKNARYDHTDVQGNILENTTQGIFGKYQESVDGKLYKVAKNEEIKTGPAKILTVTNGNTIEEYSINITKINSRKQKNKNFVFEVTDESLLEKTGGIVQGMSGSPIIQEDKIIGAVTHVVVDNPKKGYGIFITNMLEEAEN